MKYNKPARIDEFQKNIIEQNIDYVASRISEKLRERNIAIIKTRLGTGTDFPCTLIKTAEKFDISVERIRQIVAKAYHICMHERD